MAADSRRWHPWRWFWSVLAAGLAGGLLLPAGAYLAGKRVIGAYEGQNGVADYIGSIYTGAGHGEPQAFALLLAPVALLGCWATVGWAWRRLA
jgi:hypothetical protein